MRLITTKEIKVGMVVQRIIPMRTETQTRLIRVTETRDYASGFQYRGRDVEDNYDTLWIFDIADGVEYVVHKEAPVTYHLETRQDGKWERQTFHTRVNRDTGALIALSDGETVRFVDDE